MQAGRDESAAMCSTHREYLERASEIERENREQIKLPTSYVKKSKAEQEKRGGERREGSGTFPCV